MLAAIAADHLARAGVEQLEGVVDLGDRADGAAAGVPAMRLAQGDRGRNAFDAVGVGFVELRARNCRVYGEKVSM